MSVKHESIESERLFYMFVDLQPEPPTTFVVPSAKVCEVLSTAYVAWLATPGRWGQAHNESKMRRIQPDYAFPVPGLVPDWMEPFRDAWRLLERSTD